MLTSSISRTKIVSWVRSSSRACSRRAMWAAWFFNARKVVAPIAERLTRQRTRGVPTLSPCEIRKLVAVRTAPPAATSKTPRRARKLGDKKDDAHEQNGDRNIESSPRIHGEDSDGKSSRHNRKYA